MNIFIMDYINETQYTGKQHLPVYFYKNTTLKHFDAKDTLVAASLTIKDDGKVYLYSENLDLSFSTFLIENNTNLVVVIKEDHCNIILKEDYETLVQNELYELDTMTPVEIKCPGCNCKVKLTLNKPVEVCCGIEYTLKRMVIHKFSGYKILKNKTL